MMSNLIGSGSNEIVRKMLHSTLKFPEFEVVTLEALIRGNLVWGFDMNDIYLMSTMTRSDRNEIWGRNVAYYPEVPRDWSSDPGSLDLKESHVRISYERYIYIWCLIWLEAEGTKFVREMLHITLKFPEFEVVTLKALIWRILIWGFDMNDIYLWCLIWLEAEGMKFVREM